MAAIEQAHPELRRSVAAGAERLAAGEAVRSLIAVRKDHLSSVEDRLRKSLGNLGDRALPVRGRVCRRAQADGLGRRTPGPAGPRSGVPACTGRRAELSWADVRRALPVRDRVCRRAQADVPR